MAKKKEDKGCLILLIVALVLSCFALLKKSVGDIWFFIILILVIAAFIFLYIQFDKAKKKRIAKENKQLAEMIAARRASLFEKYHDEGIVDRIMDQSYWQSQTAEMLTDSLGEPVSKEESIMKTKRKEIWKYFPDGTNRFKLRITLEDDIVIGWDKRD